MLFYLSSWTWPNFVSNRSSEKNPQDFMWLIKAFIITNHSSMRQVLFQTEWLGGWKNPSQVSCEVLVESVSTLQVTSRTQLRSSWLKMGHFHTYTREDGMKTLPPIALRCPKIPSRCWRQNTKSHLPWGCGSDLWLQPRIMTVTLL